MRIAGLVSSVSVFCAFAACSSFGSGNVEEPAPSDSDGGSSGSTGAGGGGATVTGAPADDSFAIHVAAPPVPVIQGGTGTVSVTVERGKDFLDPVVITTKDFLEGVVSAPLTITKDSGDLVISAPATATQGPKSGTVVGTANGKMSTAAAALLIRGLPGSIDETFATGGITPKLSATASTLGSANSLLLAADGSYFFVQDAELDGATDLLVHVLASGLIDATYNGGSGYAGFNVTNANAAGLLPSGAVVTFGPSTFAIYGGNGSKIGGGNTPGLPSTCTEPVGAPAVAVRSDGEMFAAQYATQVCVTRFAPDGTSRSSFGPSGTGTSVVATGSVNLQGMALRPDPVNAANSKLLHVSVSANGGTGVTVQQTLTETGAPDPAFAGPHIFTLAGLQTRRRIGVAAVVPVILSDGSAIVPLQSSAGLYLFKFDVAGNAVSGFGTSGDGFAGPFQDTGGEATSIAVQTDGRLLVQLATVNNNGGLDTLRFTPDGAVDTTFGQNGRVSSAGDVVTVDKTGRVLVARRTIGLTAYWP